MLSAPSSPRVRTSSESAQQLLPPGREPWGRQATGERWARWEQNCCIRVLEQSISVWWALDGLCTRSALVHRTSRCDNLSRDVPRHCCSGCSGWTISDLLRLLQLQRDRSIPARRNKDLKDTSPAGARGSAGTAPSLCTRWVTGQPWLCCCVTLLHGATSKPQKTNKTSSKVRGSQRRILQSFLYPQAIYETQPWPEAFSTDDTMSADLAAFKIISLERDDFGIGNDINNLKIIWLLSTSRFKMKIKQGKGTNTRVHRREDLQEGRKQQLHLFVFDFQFFLRNSRHVRVNLLMKYWFKILIHCQRNKPFNLLLPLLLMKYFSVFRLWSTKAEIKDFFSLPYLVCHSSPVQLFQLFLKYPKQIKIPSGNES